MTPVSDEVFKVFREMFSYDAMPLKSETVYRDEGSTDFVYERVTYDAAYGNDRIIGHLFLPKNVSPPYQTVIYFPGSAANFYSSSEDIANYFEYPIFLSFLVKNGRAVLFPVYDGTFERQRPDFASIMESGRIHSRAYTDYTINLVKDFSRSVDYLASREDIDVDRLAYYGMSWGGLLGAIVPAVETRIETAVVAFGGFSDLGRPEAHQINYAGRITMPVLMLNGKYDSQFTVDQSVIPMFEMIGTPEDHKELKLFDSDHVIPRNDLVRETLGWLDRYLGPVK